MPSHPAEIARHAVFSYTLLATGDTWHFDGPDGPVSVRVSPRMRGNSRDVCCAAALQHQGIGQQLRSGALVEILPQFHASELGVYAVYPSRKHVTPKVRMLIDFLAAAFRRPAWQDALESRRSGRSLEPRRS